MAQQYYRKPAAMYGGGKSFKGFKVPSSLQNFNNAYYKVKRTSKELTFSTFVLYSRCWVYRAFTTLAFTNGIRAHDFPILQID